MNNNKFEKHIPYVVHLNQHFYMPYTVIGRTFCGFLVNNANGKFFFELDKSKMLVIIPYNEIEWMAPSKKHAELYNSEVNNQ